MFRNFQGKNMQDNTKSPTIFTLNGNAFIDFIKSKGLELPFGSIHFANVEPVVNLHHLPQFTFAVNNTTTAEMGFFLVTFNVKKMKGKTIDPLSAQLLVRMWLVGLQEYYHQEHGHTIEFLDNGPNHLRYHHMSAAPFGGVNMPSDEDLEKRRQAGLDNLAKTLFESMQYHASVHAEEQYAPYITVQRRNNPTGKLPFKLEALLPGQVRVLTSAEPFAGYGYDDTIKGKLFFAGDTYHISFQHYALQSALSKFAPPLQLQDALFELWADYTSELSRVNDPAWQAIELTFDEVKHD